MPRETLTNLRDQIDAATLAPEALTVATLTDTANLSETDRARICAQAASLVTRIRGASDPGMMEVFLAEYGLSTDEGIALMCLAEALLRVPDSDTIDALIEDKIAPSNWGKHLGKSASSLVNASTWALLLTGKVLDDEHTGVAGKLRGALKRLGEPVIRTAVSRAMKEMGRQFVLGTDIAKAMTRADAQQQKGYTYSYDMLGEAARTDADARNYHLSYSRAISAIATHCTHETVAQNPGISVKFSALHARYEIAQKDRVMTELVPRVRALAMLAKSAGMGFNVDAEEADRLSLSLDVIEAVLEEPALAGWDGFGVVVQAYGPRASFVLDWLHATAKRLDRKLMVRLVKGAYWDAEIKRAQTLGLDGFPVFTSKPATDISYIANARKLLGMTDHIYPQFATHNAHTVAAILDMATDTSSFEFQRLHGMGDTLHDLVLGDHSTRCRIYAPVGAHKDLLAYLVRRLLENGANSSFVNQIVDEDVSAKIVASDPFNAVRTTPLLHPADLFQPERKNSVGWDITDIPTLAQLDAEIGKFTAHNWTTGQTNPLNADRTLLPVKNPAIPSQTVGHVVPATPSDVDAALNMATPWAATPKARAEILNAAADAYEAHAPELFALLTQEAGKTLLDCVGELREAVDFMRYYAAQSATDMTMPTGRFACISPWNFPLAIFTGQISAALAAGNAVLAKPAEQTPLIAARAIEILHTAGVPETALQLLAGGGEIGAALTSDPRIDGVAFTGSTATALKIRSSMAQHLAPGAPLIAETGGLNAMIVDSTALPEHAVRDILQSAFQSAGQRCSALRCLYVQEDIADELLHMLKGAMTELSVGDPSLISTDVGPVIDALAQSNIQSYIEAARAQGRVIFDLPSPNTGYFVAPTVLRVSGISDLTHEVFGPVLHVATYKARELPQVMTDINATGYGLTFGLHTRIDDRVEEVCQAIHAGNIYVNRNQIGAVVGSQPFGGEELSGTGPKAGGPDYLLRFRAPKSQTTSEQWESETTQTEVQSQLNASARVSASEPHDLPGPTGESNRLSATPRAPLLCLGPGTDTAQKQAKAVVAAGGRAVCAAGHLEPSALTTLFGFSGVIYWAKDAPTARDYTLALSQRDGPILPLITAQPDRGHATSERHICIDTTASGGNAELLAQIGAPA